MSLLNGFCCSPQRQHCSETCSHRRWREWVYILWMVSTLPSMPLMNFPAAFTKAVCHVILKIRLFRSVRGCFMNSYMHWDCITVLMLWSCENMFGVIVDSFHSHGLHPDRKPQHLGPSNTLFGRCNEIIPQDWIKENIQVQVLYNFFVKCTVLPPGGLFHPGLSYR